MEQKEGNLVWLHGLNSRYQRKYTETETDWTCLDFLILVDIVNFCSLVTFPMIIRTGNMNQYLVYVYLHCFLLLLFIIDYRYIYFGNYLPVNILCIYHVNMYIIDLALYIWFCRYKQNYMYIQIWGIFEFIRAKHVLYILIISKMAFAEEQWLFNRLSISDC